MGPIPRSSGVWDSRSLAAVFLLRMPLTRSRLGLLLLGVLFTFLLYLLLPAAHHEQRSAGIRTDKATRNWPVASAIARTGMAAGEPPVFYREVSAGPQGSGAAGPGRWVSPSAPVPLLEEGGG